MGFMDGNVIPGIAPTHLSATEHIRWVSDTTLSAIAAFAFGFKAYI